jgi:hypothetical protein
MKRLVSMIPLAGALFVASPTDAHASLDAKSHYSLWGIDVCIDEAPPGIECDVRLKSPKASTDKTYAGVFRLFDTRVCLGAVDAARECWIRVPTPDDEKERRGS